MIDTHRVWQSSLGGLSIDDAIVSFQRFLCPAGKVVSNAPSSHGALPVASDGDHYLLPLPRREAFWVGILLPGDWDQGTLHVAAARADGTVLASEQFDRPGMFVVAGIRRPDGQFEVFCPESVSELSLTSDSGTARVVVCDPQAFAVRTGQMPPETFDPDATFGGWKLP